MGFEPTTSHAPGANLRPGSTTASWDWTTVPPRRLPVRDVRPHYKGKIINTLIKLKAVGLSGSSLKTISDRLMHLARYSDLDDPHSVEQFIASKDGKVRTGSLEPYGLGFSIKGLKPLSTL